MTLREQFEAWILSINRCYDEDDLKVFHGEGDKGYYCNQSLDMAWCGFQAGYEAAGKVVKPLVSACSAALSNDEVSEGFGARNMEDDLRQVLAKAIEEGEAFMKGHGDVAGD